MYDDYQWVYYNYCNTKQQYEKALLKKVAAKYKKEQPVLDIQQQLKDLPLVEEEMVQVEEYAFMERNWVI